MTTYKKASKSSCFIRKQSLSGNLAYSLSGCYCNLLNILFIAIAFVFFSSPVNADDCDLCSGAHSGSRIEIYNNLGSQVDILTNAGLFGSCTWDGTKVPPCLRQIDPGSSRAITISDHSGFSPNWGYNFATANPRVTV